MFKSVSRSKGFTLIELLVVISIIGILASVVYASFGGAREQARNKSMMSELKEMQLALEIYKAQNGQYPAAPSVGNPCDSSSGGNDIAVSSGCGSLGYVFQLVPTFIASLPSHNDSNNPSCEIQYEVEGTNFSSYKLTAIQCFEGATQASEGIGQNNDFARCPSTCASSGVCVPANAAFYESMAVYSAGGECY